MNMSLVHSLRRRVLGLSLLGALLVSAWPAHAFTLIVAPARYSVMQVAMDVLQRSPAVLVSYQGEPDSAEPRLHAWNGKEWVAVSMKDFREASFLQRVPDGTVLIGNDDVLPKVLQDAASWSPRVDRVTDLSTGALVNEFGRVLKWRTADWKWFAKRYNLDLKDESEPRRRSSWYDQPGPLPDRPKLIPHRPSAPADGTPVPVVTLDAAPVEQVDVEPVSAEPVVEPATEPVSEPVP